jgi:hypothetical protein
MAQHPIPRLKLRRGGPPGATWPVDQGGLEPKGAGVPCISLRCTNWVAAHWAGHQERLPPRRSKPRSRSGLVTSVAQPADRHGRFHPLTELVEWLGSGRNDSFLAESFVINSA